MRRSLGRHKSCVSDQIDKSEVRRGDAGILRLISSSDFAITSNTRYRKIPPPMRTSKIAPSRIAVSVMVASIARVAFQNDRTLDLESTRGLDGMAPTLSPEAGDRMGHYLHLPLFV